MEETEERKEERKEKLLADCHRLVRTVHNEGILDYEEIVGCVSVVMFDYMQQLRENHLTLEAKAENDERGLFT